MKKAFNKAFKNLSKEVAKEYRDEFKAVQGMIKAAGKTLKSLKSDSVEESSADEEQRLARQAATRATVAFAAVDESLTGMLQKVQTLEADTDFQDEASKETIAAIIARLEEALTYFKDLKAGVSESEADSELLDEAQKQIKQILREFKNEIKELKKGQDSEGKEEIEAMLSQYEDILNEAREQCKKAREISEDSEKAGKKRREEGQE